MKKGSRKSASNQRNSGVKERRAKEVGEVREVICLTSQRKGGGKHPIEEEDEENEEEKEKKKDMKCVR